MSLRHHAGACCLVLLSHAGALAAQTVPPPATPATEAFARAIQLHDAGKFTDAAAEFERAVTLGFQPVNMARVRIIRALIRAGDHDKALTLLEQMAAGGFPNVGALTSTDMDAVRSMPRFQAASARVTRNANPCADDPNFRAFDFWIGEWDVQNTATPRAPMGQGATSVITRSLNGCAIEEHWMPVGGAGAGKSLNSYNTVTRQWEQYYVDAMGTITHYTGNFRDGTLYFEANQFGSTNKIRMTFFNQGPAQVRQLGHVSSDGGKTWTVSFDLTYVRKPALPES